MQIICCEPTARRPACRGLLLTHRYTAQKLPRAMSGDTWQVRSQVLMRPPLWRDIFKGKLEIKFFFSSCPNKEQQSECETAFTKAVALIFAKQQVLNVDGHGIVTAKKKKKREEMNGIFKRRLQHLLPFLHVVLCNVMVIQTSIIQIIHLAL